jgi:hypothetical protein
MMERGSGDAHPCAASFLVLLLVVIAKLGGKLVPLCVVHHRNALASAAPR